jgi:hypothetical protein
MPQAAYAIVGIVGVTLLIETLSHIHITEVTKFAMVLGIALYTVWYEHSLLLRRISNPILKTLQYIIAIPIDIAYAVKNVFLRVFSKVA